LSTGGNIPSYLAPGCMYAWFPLLLVNKGEIFPHTLHLAAYTLGSLFCWSTGGNIPSYL
jgi:hypothetical protein